MWAVLKAHSGWGLAAIQIGDSSPAIVVRAPGNQKIELINPVLEKRIGRRRVSTEGCLSYNKGLTMVKVLRYPMVTVSGLDRNLRPVRYSAKIQQAAALQHEIDHLYGINIANHPDSVG
jgi:peptide deformylase